MPGEQIVGQDASLLSEKEPRCSILSFVSIFRDQVSHSHIEMRGDLSVVLLASLRLKSYSRKMKISSTVIRDKFMKELAPQLRPKSVVGCDLSIEDVRFFSKYTQHYML